MKSILNLISVVLIPVLTEWVEVKNLVDLDSAFTNNQDREIFLKLIEGDNFVHNFTSTECVPRSFYDWLSIRNLKVKRLDLPGLEKRKLRQSEINILRNHKKLDHLEISFCHTAKAVFDCYCNDIRSLKLLNGQNLTDDEFSEMLSKITGLRAIDISTCTKLTSISCQKIADLLPYLECYTDHHNKSTGFIMEPILRNGVNLREIIFLGQNSNDNVRLIAKCCPNLTKLRLLSYSEINDDTLTLVAINCLKLEFLEICSEKFTDKSICKLAECCKNLKHLNVSAADECTTRISDISLFALAANCQFLNCLNLDGSKEITDKGVMTLVKNCIKLETIVIDDCSKITNIAVLYIAKQLKKLKFISLRKCPLVTEISICELIANCVMLERINIDNNSTNEIAYVKFAQNCKCLSIQNEASFCVMAVNRIQGVSLAAIYLRTVTKPLSNITLQTISYLCPQLSVLILYDMTLLTDDVLIAIMENCPLLEILFVQNAPLLTAAYVTHASEKCSKINSIEIDNLVSLTDEIMNKFVKTRPFMKTISMFRCGKITDVTINTIGEHCSQLKKLVVDETHITDTSIHNLVQNCQYLHHLDVENCKKLTDKTLTNITVYCNNLSHLTIIGCKLMTSQGIVNFALQNGDNITEFLHD